MTVPDGASLRSLFPRGRGPARRPGAGSCKSESTIAANFSPSFFFHGHSSHAAQVTRSDFARSASKIAVCSSANCASRMLSLASSLRRNERWSKRVAPTADGQPMRRETSFHDNGKKAAEGLSALPAAGTRGAEHASGMHRSWDAEGRLRAENTCDARGLPGHERGFDASGVPTRDDELFEDGSRKARRK